MKSLYLSVVTILALATSAHAVEPLGCFTDFSSAALCSEGEIYCGDYEIDNLIAFGAPIAGLCTQINTLDELTQIDAVIQEALRGHLADAEKTIRKLRKACGSKCKRIK